MPLLDVGALRRIMTRRNYLFKHQLANLVGLSYEQLTRIIADGEAEVEEDIVRRLCNGLECERADIVTPE
jgi:DNA-binding Xre family transcriptional regulator